MILTELKMYFHIDFNKKFINFPGGLLRDDFRTVYKDKSHLNVFLDKIKRK